MSQEMVMGSASDKLRWYFATADAHKCVWACVCVFASVQYASICCKFKGKAIIITYRCILLVF